MAKVYNGKPFDGEDNAVAIYLYDLVNDFMGGELCEEVDFDDVERLVVEAFHAGKAYAIGQSLPEPGSYWVVGKSPDG